MYLKGFQPISTVPSLIYQITFKKLYHIIPSLVYQTISKKIKNQEVNRLSCPLRSSVRKAVFKFGLSCNQLKNKQNLTVENQRGSENKDKRPEVKLLTQRKS